MKKTVKNSLALGSVGLMALTAVCAAGFSDKTVYADEPDEYQITVQQCEQVISDIADNLDEIVAAYNETVEDEQYLNAEYIEYRSLIKFIDDDTVDSNTCKTFAYIDFNGDNGYAIVSPEREIYDVVVDGDYAYARDNQNLYYGISSKFMYMDGNGNFQPYEIKEFTDEIIGCPCIEPYKDSQNNLLRGPVIPPPQPTMDGNMDSSAFNTHISNYYLGYSLQNYITCNGYSSFVFTKQYNTSYYIAYNKKVGAAYSEGNCALNAMYNVINNWNNSGYINLKRNATINVYNGTAPYGSDIHYDTLYSVWGVGTKKYTNNTEYIWESNGPKILQNMPQLYDDIRDYAVNTNSYKPEGGYSVSYFIPTMTHVLKDLNNIRDPIESTFSPETARIQIQNGRSCVLVMDNSLTYNCHAVALIGYKEYKKTRALSTNLTMSYTYYFYEIADGWENTAQFFDPNVASNLSLQFFYIARC